VSRVSVSCLLYSPLLHLYTVASTKFQASCMASHFVLWLLVENLLQYRSLVFTLSVSVCLPANHLCSGGTVVVCVKGHRIIWTTLHIFVIFKDKLW